MTLKFRILTIISIVGFLLNSCKPVTNFNKIKEYLGQTSTSSSLFKSESKIINDFKCDTIKVLQKTIVHNDFIYYEININGNIFIFCFTPTTFKITKDSNSCFSIFESGEYSRKTKDVFNIPDFEKINGMYREYNDRINKSNPSLELNWEYPYRAYMTIKDNELILHKEYSFKTDRNDTYYFSKKTGLYKIEMDGMVILTKINNAR